MRHAQVFRSLGWALVAGWAVGSTGCVHHHYYGPGAQVYDAPTTGAVTSHYGSVCEVAPATPGVLVSRSPGRTTILGGPSRVVINSEPVGRSGGRPAARGWRGAEPGLAANTSGGVETR